MELKIGFVSRVLDGYPLFYSVQNVFILYHYYIMKSIAQFVKISKYIYV